MKALSCPHCNRSLASLVCAGIEVDRCEDCGGLWFDAAEAEQLKAVAGSESIDQGSRNLTAACTAQTGERPGGTQRDRHCPRCHVKMTRVLDMDEHNVWYEQCPNCGGTWLDAGEFRQFKENFRERNFLRRARERLGFKI